MMMSYDVIDHNLERREYLFYIVMAIHRQNLK